jgi:hypothetical protein
MFKQCFILSTSARASSEVFRLHSYILELGQYQHLQAGRGVQVSWGIFSVVTTRRCEMDVDTCDYDCWIMNGVTITVRSAGKSPVSRSLYRAAAIQDLARSRFMW